MKRLFLVLLFVPSLLWAQANSREPIAAGVYQYTAPVLPAGSKIAMAYLGIWNWPYGAGGTMPTSAIDFSAWNWLTVFQVWPDSTTDSITTGVYSTTFTKANIALLSDSMHAHNGKLICSIGVSAAVFRGWLGYQRGGIAADTIHVIMGKLKNFVSSWGFDGIDIDWEQQTTADTAYWAMLMDSLGANFPSPQIVTATGQWGSNYAAYGRVASHITAINIMTYDMTAYASPGWNSWFQAPVYSGSEVNALGNPNPSINMIVNDFRNAGCPANKLMIATSPVGNLWTEKSTTVMMNYNNTQFTHAGPDSFNQSWLGSWSPGNLTYAPQVSGDIPWYNSSGTGVYQKYMDAANAVYHWDSTHEASWISHDSTDSMYDWYMAFDDSADMRAKIQYVQDSALGGFFFYEIGEAYNSQQSGYIPVIEYIKQEIISIWKQNP